MFPLDSDLSAGTDLAAGTELPDGTAGADTGPGTLAIPLAVGEGHVRVVSITRVSPAFSARELLLAAHLQPVLAGI